MVIYAIQVIVSLDSKPLTTSLSDRDDAPLTLRVAGEGGDASTLCQPRGARSFAGQVFGVHDPPVPDLHLRYHLGPHGFGHIALTFISHRIGRRRSCPAQVVGAEQERVNAVCAGEPQGVRVCGEAHPEAQRGGGLGRGRRRRRRGGNLWGRGQHPGLELHERARPRPGDAHGEKPRHRTEAKGPRRYEARASEWERGGWEARKR